ncbi:MAG: aminopeptidase [Anaerolineales bacterium]|jgi:aminopeptidase
METLSFEQKLQRYADLTVKVGLNLQPGQRLFVIAYPLDVAPMLRPVVKSAYQNGCRLVNVAWVDEQEEKFRYQYAPHDSFEEFQSWITNGVAQGIEHGDAYLQIYGANPKLLEDQNPELIAIAGRTQRRYFKPINVHQGKNSVQWSVICPSTPGWAAQVFPDKPLPEAEAKLWEAIFKACRIEEPDPIAFWQQQAIGLSKRKDHLTAKQFTALHFTGPGTDLHVGLPKGHIWSGGESQTPGGISFMPNLPTEEVYTLPHKDKTHGTVTATKPRSYLGNLIENFSLTFSEGKVVNFSAQKGEETLRNILGTDENAKRLGEVALIPHQTPISQSSLIFLNILYDENASNHLALGRAYRYTLKDGEEMTDEEFAQAGGNDSLIHVDFMFGSGEMDVDGLLADGTSEAVMRSGEWAFDI